MREKVEAFAGVSEAKAEREPAAEILSGALLGAQSKDLLRREAKGFIRSNHA
jgi:hypothetical protein